MEQYVLHVTRNCNLRCRYCYETDRTTTYTNEEVLESAKNIIKNSNRSYSVEFFGGEPLLAFGNIIVAYEFFKQHAIESGKDIRFTISTNLVELTDTMLEWLVPRKDIRLSISLDGDQFMNQLRVYKNHNESYTTVVTNIKKCLVSLGCERVSVHMVAHPFNVGYLSHGIKHIYDIGVKSIAAGIVESTIDIGDEFAKTYIFEMNKISLDIISGKLPGLSVSELCGLKPESDIRTYVYDDDGKIIFESYGRSKDDAISREEVNIVKPYGPVAEIVNYIRRSVYTIHQNRVNADKYEPIYYNYDDIVDFECELSTKNIENLYLTTLTVDGVGHHCLTDNKTNGENALLKNELFARIRARKYDAPLSFVIDDAGIGFDVHESTCNALSNLVIKKALVFDNYLPTIDYKSSITEYLTKIGNSIYIKDLSFGIYPCIMVICVDKGGVYRHYIKSSYNKKLAIDQALAFVCFENPSKYNLERFTKGRVIEYNNIELNENVELSNLSIIDNQEIWQTEVNQNGVPYFITLVR